MYQVFLFIVFVAYCSSAPFASSNIRKSVTENEEDMSDLIDNQGSGYSYFIKQNIDTQSSAASSLDDISSQDPSIYMQASALDERPTRKQTYVARLNQRLNNAYGPQQSTARSKLPMQNQRPKFTEKDSLRFPSGIANQYTAQQAGFPVQSEFSNANPFGNQRQADLRRIGSQQQLAFPQSNSNFQNQMFNHYQPHHAWSTQPKSTGFNFFHGVEGQAPAASNFLIQARQQNDQAPITNAFFRTSQLPIQQRFTSFKQQSPSNLWE